MSNDVDLVVDDLLSQLKGSSAAAKELKKDEFNLDKEELESFLLNYSGKLIKGTVDYVEEVKQFITSAPDSRDVDALSKLVGASASAIESLNKILLQDKANEAKIHVKELDIQSKKELQEKNNERLGLTINREELLKQLVDDAKKDLDFFVSHVDVYDTGICMLSGLYNDNTCWGNNTTYKCTKPKGYQKSFCLSESEYGC